MNALWRKVSALVLLVAVLVLVNHLASRVPAQVDLTNGRFFTLSDASTQMLEQMDKPVQVELYFSSSRKGLQIGLKVFAQRVEQLLRQYERRSGGKVQVKVIDPTPGSPEEEEARRLGLLSQPLGPDERLYFGLAVFHGGNRRTIPLIDYRRERLLEYDISRLIRAVQNHSLPKLAVVSSLEVFGTRGMPKEMQKVEDGTAEWQFIREMRDSYELEEVMPTNETLPGDAEILLVINPSGFDPRLLHAIDQFILSGRPAVVLLDPHHYHEVVRDETDGMVLGAEYHKTSDLPQFLPNWGVRYTVGEIVGDLANPTHVPVQENHPPIPFPIWITLRAFEDTQPVTAGFNAVLLAHVGQLSPLPEAKTTFTPLLRSSPKSAVLRVETVERTHPNRIGDIIEPTGEAYTVAAAVEGHFQTAYPNGKPPAPPETGSTGEPDPWDLGLKESTGTSRVIIVADADFIQDPMAYQVVGRSGGTLVTRPRNNNAALVGNSVDHLRGSHGMLPIRAKVQSIRPFKRIHDLRIAAEENFRQEVQTINTRLNQLDAELADLHEQAARGGSSLVSEKALTAIRRAQKEQNSLQAHRLEIQQQLQRAIAAEHRWLTGMNLAVVPAFLALGGIGFWMYRTRRRVER